jgi:hypothetical protein
VNTTLLYLDVDTSQCGFKKTPRYFVTINGDMSKPGGETFAGPDGVVRLLLYGDSVAYKVSPTGFRLYLLTKSAVQAQIAMLRSTNWLVSWIGVSATDTLDETTGTIGANWKTQLSDEWISTEVSTRTHAFKKIPRYIVSLSSTLPSFSLAGPTLVDNERRQNFKFYVRDPVLDITDLSPEIQSSSFAVNYFGYKDPAYWDHVAPVKLKQIDSKAKQTASIRLDAELYGQGISDFTVKKRRLLLSGLSTLLNLPLTDISIVNTIPWSEKIIIELEVVPTNDTQTACLLLLTSVRVLQVNVRGALEIEAAESSIRSKKFAVSVEHRMRLANEGTWPYPKGFRATFSKPEVVHSEATEAQGVGVKGFGMLPGAVMFGVVAVIGVNRVRKRRQASNSQGYRRSARSVVPQDQVPEDFALLYKV